MIDQQNRRSAFAQTTGRRYRHCPCRHRAPGEKTFEAVFKTEEKSFQLMIDEPEVRGGKGSGPTPLGYFVTGAASCLMMQYANVLKEKPMPVETSRCWPVRTTTARREFSPT